MVDEKEMLQSIHAQWEHILHAFQDQAKLEPEQIVVIGCSTSEVLGHRIGKGSSLAVAETILESLQTWANENRVYLAIQCCEHLNRVLVVEKECAVKYNLEAVIVEPSLHAGGALSLQAWKKFTSPLAVESIRAHAGIDIGDTFIGMHLRPVVVPIRIDNHQLGAGHVTMARTRPKYVGGPRAAYPCI